MDFQLSDEQVLIRDWAREFAERVIVPVERYLRDARVTTRYEGTAQIQKLIIGRAATGINAMMPLGTD